MDKSASERGHQWVLWITLQIRRKNRSAKPLKCELCGPRVLTPRVLAPRVLTPRLWPRVSKSHGMINRGLEELRGGGYREIGM